MDINNYSYINSKTEETIIAHSGTVFFTLDCNYFNEKYYTVENVLSDTDIKVFGLSEYSSATEYYNSLVPDSEKI